MINVKFKGTANISEPTLTHSICKGEGDGFTFVNNKRVNIANLFKAFKNIEADTGLVRLFFTVIISGDRKGCVGPTSFGTVLKIRNS